MSQYVIACYTKTGNNLKPPKWRMSTINYVISMMGITVIEKNMIDNIDLSRYLPYTG